MFEPQRDMLSMRIWTSTLPQYVDVPRIYYDVTRILDTYPRLKYRFLPYIYKNIDKYAVIIQGPVPQIIKKARIHIMIPPNYPAKPPHLKLIPKPHHYLITNDPSINECGNINISYLKLWNKNNSEILKAIEAACAVIKYHAKVVPATLRDKGAKKVIDTYRTKPPLPSETPGTGRNFYARAHIADISYKKDNQTYSKDKLINRLNLLKSKHLKAGQKLIDGTKKKIKFLQNDALILECRIQSAHDKLSDLKKDKILGNKYWRAAQSDLAQAAVGEPDPWIWITSRDKEAAELLENAVFQIYKKMMQNSANKLYIQGAIEPAVFKDLQVWCNRVPAAATAAPEWAGYRHEASTEEAGNTQG